MQMIGTLFNIKPGEGRLTGYFVALFILTGFGIAVAKGSADVLFLKRYGVENLAWVYVGLSIVLAVTCTVYAAYVERVSSESLLKVIFGVQLSLLLVAWLFMTVLQEELVYPVYYAMYSLSSELMLVHGAFYLGQNLDTLQSKRLMPVVMGGYQMGMIGGGMLLMFVVPRIGLDATPLLWALFTFLSMALMAYWHRRYGASPFYFPKGKSGRHKLRCAIEEFTKGLEFSRKNNLLRNASVALVLLVITFYMMSYTAHVIYTRTFETEQSLASFFGALLIGTYSAAMLLQMFVSNRVIEFMGVRRTKLIYAVTTILSFAFLILHPGFFAALFASINRETIMPAFRNPARQLFFNVLPEYMKGRARAISIAVVMPVALLICGGLILFMQQYDSIQAIAGAGLVLALVYMLYCIRMGREYVATLIQSMREKLYLPNELVRHYHDSSSALLKELANGLNSKDDDVSLSYARAMVLSFPDASVGYILERIASAEVPFADQMIKLIDANIDKASTQRLQQVMSRGDDHLRATVLAAIFRSSAQSNADMILETLKDTSPRVRCSGVRAAICAGPSDLRKRGLHVWHDLLMGSDEDKRACIELIDLLLRLDDEDRRDMLAATRNVITQVIAVSGEQRRRQIYGYLRYWRWPLPEVVCRSLKQDTSHAVPAMRAAAVRCIRVLEDRDAVVQYLWQGLDDGHMQVRRAALEVIGELYPARNTFAEWMTGSMKGSPRAHSALLEKAIENGLTHDELNRTIIDKTAYAATLLSALKTLEARPASTPALQVLRKTLEERYNQLVDLVLVALDPLIDSGDVMVIRAGLNTRDPRYRADAMEALQSLDSGRLSRQLIDLVGQDYNHLVRAGLGRAFNGTHEVLSWCIDETDHWLRRIALAARNEHAGEAVNG